MQVFSVISAENVWLFIFWGINKSLDRASCQLRSGQVLPSMSYKNMFWLSGMFEFQKCQYGIIDGY